MGRAGFAALAVAAAIVVTACGSRLLPPPDLTPPAAAQTTGVCGVAAGRVTGTTLFASDLSSRCRVFDNRVNPDLDVETVHDGNGYRVTLKSGPGAVWADVLVSTQYATSPPADVQIEVDVETVRGSDRDLVGIICRSVGTRLAPGRWYHLLVGGDGSYLIQFGDLRGSNQIERTLASGKGPVPKAGANRVRADCVGSTLSLYLNGQHVTSVNDAEAADGYAGIYMRTGDAGGAQFLFKNLIVTRY